MLRATIKLFILFLLFLNFSCKLSGEKHPENLINEIDFIKEVASQGVMEMELGKLAQQFGSSPKVKEFGFNMSQDHAEVLEQLKQLSTNKNVSLSLTPLHRHTRHLERLSQLKGGQFDKEYISLMVDEHEKGVNKHERMAKEGKDPEVKAFAHGQLSAVQQHLDMAKAIKNILKE